MIPWPDAVSFGDVVYPPGGTLGPRLQPYLQLVMLRSGRMTLWVDGARREAQAMTVCILLPGHQERFEFAADRETWHSYAHIALPDAPTWLLKRLQRLPWPLPFSARMRELTDSALELRNAVLPTIDDVRKALALQMLWQYLGEGELGALTSGENPTVAAACAFVRAHLDEPLDLTRIAAAAAVSPSHLIRLFRETLNSTPVAYLWEQRARHGVELLEHTGLPVGVIADRCGFASRHHFARRIRAATGFAPTALRDRAWRQ
jgi:AraC family transcriptional regulator of arabinose operon